MCVFYLLSHSLRSLCQAPRKSTSARCLKLIFIDPSLLDIKSADYGEENRTVVQLYQIVFLLNCFFLFVFLKKDCYSGLGCASFSFSRKHMEKISHLARPHSATSHINTHREMVITLGRSPLFTLCISLSDSSLSSYKVLFLLPSYTFCPPSKIFPYQDSCLHKSSVNLVSQKNNQCGVYVDSFCISS